MENNIFMTDRKPISFEEYLQYDEKNRGNLGEELPVLVYRMLEYSRKRSFAAAMGKRRRWIFSVRQAVWQENILQSIC